MIISQEIRAKMTRMLYRYLPPSIRNKPWSLKLFLLFGIYADDGDTDYNFLLIILSLFSLLSTNPNKTSNISFFIYVTFVSKTVSRERTRLKK